MQIGGWFDYFGLCLLRVKADLAKRQLKDTALLVVAIWI
jgi:hypothetical protein